MKDFDIFTKNCLIMWEIWAKIVATGFKKLPNVQKIAQSGHTGQQLASYESTHLLRKYHCTDDLLFGSDETYLCLIQHQQKS